jgi:hypothetical protein
MSTPTETRVALCGLAMAALIRMHVECADDEDRPKAVAASAVTYVDALLAELAKPSASTTATR